MDSNIYIEIDGEPVGPLTRQEVQQKLLNDECTLDSPAWTEGNEDSPRTLRKVMGMSSGGKALKAPGAESDAEKRRRQAAAEIARIAKREEKKRDVATGKKSSNLGGLVSLLLILLIIGGGLFYYFTVIAPSQSATESVAAAEEPNTASAPRPSVPTSQRSQEAAQSSAPEETSGSSASTGRQAAAPAPAPQAAASPAPTATQAAPSSPEPEPAPTGSAAAETATQAQVTSEIQNIPMVDTAKNDGAFAVNWKEKKVVVFNGAILMEEPTLPTIRDQDKQQNHQLSSALLVPQTEIALSPLPQGFTLDGLLHTVPEPGEVSIQAGQSVRVGWERQARVQVEEVEQHRIIMQRSRYAKPGAPVKVEQDGKEYVVGIVAGFEMRPELGRLQRSEIPRGRTLVWRLDTAQQFVPYDPQKFKQQVKALEESYELTDSLMSIGFGRRDKLDMHEMTRYVNDTDWPSSLRTQIERFQNSAKGRLDPNTQKRVVVDLLKAFISEARRDIDNLNRNVDYGVLNVRVNSESRARETIISNLQPATE